LVLFNVFSHLFEATSENRLFDKEYIALRIAESNRSFRRANFLDTKVVVDLKLSSTAILVKQRQFGSLGPR
jgi:hypothetical protein